MKHWLIIAMLSASFTAFGQERTINDLMYLPDSNTFYAKGSFDMNTQKYDIKKSGNDGDVRLKERVSTLDLGYALKDNFALELSLGFRSVAHFEDFDLTAEKEYKTDGILNPVLRGKWRALDQRTENINVDIIPYLSPKIQSAKDDNETTGNGYGVEVNVGKKKEEYQIMGLAKINHTMSYETHNFTYDPRTRYEIGGIYQRTFVKSLFGNFSISRIHTDDYRDDSNNGNFERYTAQDSWSLGLEGLITPVKDLALSLGYKHFIVDDFSSKNNSGSKTKYDNIKASTITMSARYQF